uniref:MACPF domain-containing protein n=1 Tax=Corethron hystrix TaxID=216773 RepID=A0A7S1B8G7_9STRA|mmetsp:Transcript_16007/g.36042  ORF Transcript_16007/g.36042 Transcript_16007/m.36042 type:complete len:484 (+) Transcript_16007:175-1626(+)
MVSFGPGFRRRRLCDPSPSLLSVLILSVPCAIAFSRDISPLVGRGYSRSTGTFYQTCMSFNKNKFGKRTFDYSMDFFSGSDISGNMSGVTKFPSYSWIVENIGSGPSNANSAETTFQHSAVTILSIDKYYGGVQRDTEGMISPGATNLLDASQTAEFFANCGPGFVRSVRRRSEVVSLFMYKTGSAEESTNFENAIRAGVARQGDGTSQFLNTLVIKIKALGVRFFQRTESQRTENLIAHDINSYMKVMDSASSAILHTKSASSGVVISFEVIPWAHNMHFYGLASLDLELNMESGQANIPKAMRKMNLLANSEFLAGLEYSISSWMNDLATLNSCVGELRSMLGFHGETLLVRRPDYTVPIIGAYTVRMLYETLMGAQDLDNGNISYLYTRQMSDLRQYTNNYYSQCVGVFEGDDYGLLGGKIQTTFWIDIQECNTPEKCNYPLSYFDAITGHCDTRTRPEDLIVRELVQTYCSPILQGVPI